MNRHLIAVKVGVKRGANQWVKLDRFAFDQGRFKRLNAKTVQCRRAVEHHRMLADHVFENIPDHRFLAFNQFFSGFDRSRQTHHFETIENEGLKQLESHQLGQTALV